MVRSSETGPVRSLLLRYDQILEMPPDPAEIQWASFACILLDGRMDVDNVNERFELALPNEDYDTLGGFIYGELGHVPQPGEAVINECGEFIVEEVVARRILKVKVCLKSGEIQPTEGDTNNAI